MNYYSRYPSHYLSKTLLLTLEQDGAYGRLMDWYYSEERQIPHDKRYTIGRCQSSKERAAVDFVLGEYFYREGDCWMHDRIEREIAKSATKIDAARSNGQKGGRPRKNKPIGFGENNPLGFSKETQSEPITKAPQSPIPREALSNPAGLEVIASANDLPTADESRNATDEAKADRCPIQRIVELYHTKLPSCRRCEKVTPARAGYIRQRWREDLPTLDAWGNFYEYAAQSAFLTGRTQGRDGKPPFVADIEFLTKPASFAKIAEGKYHQ
jgi:uncharacterized protein YdaU (DUF1376 family)